MIKPDAPLNILSTALLQMHEKCYPGDQRISFLMHPILRTDLKSKYRLTSVYGKLASTEFNVAFPFFQRRS